VLLVPVVLRAQNYRRNEMWVGSEPEYHNRARALAYRLSYADVLVRKPQPIDERFAVLRSAVATVVNTGFPWRGDRLWNGRGPNVLASAGGTAHFKSLSIRLEPVIGFASNCEFPLEGASGFRDAMVRSGIDLPQRFGDKSSTFWDPGESHIAVELFGLSAGLSSEKMFWGPGVKHALLFSSSGPGFPRFFAGTAGPTKTPVGWIHGQLVYGRLLQSAWAAPAPTEIRFGTGFVGWWNPWNTRLSVGASRFYHREWPKVFQVNHILAPFGSFLFDEERFGGGVPDNQLVSLFANLRIPEARAEVFAEFGRNDRNIDLRDLSLEPEHNSAFLWGFQKAFRVDSAAGVFWSARLEAASGRVSSIQAIGREQATFYEHASITQGHTHRGLLLGTPLIERGGGGEFAFDRFDAKGRFGVLIFQRQMPPDLRLTQPVDLQRTQWDLRFSGVRLVGRSELTWQLGNVWDLNRFPGRDASSLYLGTGWRFGF
jgi:hypothetical protein